MGERQCNKSNNQQRYKCCKYIENYRYFIYTGHMKEKIPNKRI